ncbi:BLUF domain-containing protein [Paracoccus liaowanqingii]|uniref:BLUF domain-containing protein n=1 Tax=Paracoccus liaowanqingii TaxID=2560053 RepID=A0A4P7HNU9_9RHOB|nr:BLUF domain-containing protein [Paracoccus liaowanqingii]QBX35047.1 BLUF domain-containing protein [Paracoccus liaowanqingii]
MTSDRSVPDDLSRIDGLGFVLYRSTARPGLENEDMRAILKAARSRNQTLGLTGCLHHEDGLFFQWLEGPGDGLARIMASLKDDGRHDGIVVLDQGPLDRRRFQDWHMRFSDRDHASLMDWFARSDTSTVHPAEYAGGVVSFMMSMAR